MNRSNYDPDSLLVGVLGRPHGVKGELMLRIYNNDDRGADFTRVPILILERGAEREPRRVQAARRVAEGWLVHLEGVGTRDEAAALTNLPVRVARDLLPTLVAGEFFVSDLIGCRVDNEAGDVLGVAQATFWNGAQDVLSVVRRGDGRGTGDSEREILIPIVPTVVRAVDVSARRMIVDWSDVDGSDQNDDDNDDDHDDG